MEKNRQIPLDRNESNPMLMGLLELVKEDSLEMQKCQKALNEAMGTNDAIKELMEQHTKIRTELQNDQQKKVAGLMSESEAVQAKVEQHKKELMELQARQRQEIEAVMSEDTAIVEELKHQREELNTLRLNQQKELNDAISTNPDLTTQVSDVKEARRALLERQQMFDQEMFRARYMTPVMITPEPEKDEEGNVKLAEGSQIAMQILPVKNKDMKGVMMAFTDAKELQKWEKASEMHTLSMTMQDFIGNVLKDPKLAGVAINPFGANVLIPRERMEMMVKAAMSQKQAAMAKKNVEVVEADINE